MFCRYKWIFHDISWYFQKKFMMGSSQIWLCTWQWRPVQVLKSEQDTDLLHTGRIAEVQHWPKKDYCSASYRYSYVTAMCMYTVYVCVYLYIQYISIYIFIYIYTYVCYMDPAMVQLCEPHDDVSKPNIPSVLRPCSKCAAASISRAPHGFRLVQRGSQVSIEWLVKVCESYELSSLAVSQMHPPGLGRWYKIRTANYDW